MNNLYIQNYFNEIDKVKQFGATQREDPFKPAFIHLVNCMAEPKQLRLISELDIRSKRGDTIRPDGILRNILQLDYGYWESKNSQTNLLTEIEKKFDRGYPSDNILFEDTERLILFQDNKEVINVKSRKDLEGFEEGLNLFINYERPEVKSFNATVANFGQFLPNILDSLRDAIEKANVENLEYRKQRDIFLTLCQESISPAITLNDVREMLIQHILTEDIFTSVFNNADYHRENNIAQELYRVEKTFLRGETKQDLLSVIRPYYDNVKARANQLVSHHEKQKFLKVIYESFYKDYNPKGADKLGIVYTPNEIVKFMVDGTNHLLNKHFNKTLGDEGVSIIDPCTGTGTYITEIIQTIPTHQLEYKYKNEIHANEMALLPYYIANLNIEAVYQNRMNKYAEFKNLCFVDTLDNVMGLRTKAGYSSKGVQMNFGNISSVNLERIRSQNTQKISVIIGNPPYNANQQNENDNNKNRSYPQIDAIIKDTYIKQSTAQKTKVYDMYSRFLCWASNRIEEKGDGIVSFICNRSFIDSRTFDGFRKTVAEDFSHIYIIDTKSDVRANPKISGTKHNVFGIQTGVAILFMIRKKEKHDKCRIEYFTLTDEQTKEEKLDWFGYITKSKSFNSIPFKLISPDAKGNWINQTDNDFDDLMAVCDKDVKNGKGKEAVFKLYSLGVVTNRDDWVYDFNKEDLEIKVQFFCNFYQKEKYRWLNSNRKTPIKDFVNRTIKWTSELENHANKNSNLDFSSDNIINSLYRPFTKQYIYFDKIITHRIYQNSSIFGYKHIFDNKIICFSISSRIRNYSVLASDKLTSLALYVEPTQCLPFYIYDKEGNKKENITNWSLKQFQNNYKDKKITKEAIFNYIYAVLHNPKYRKKYAQNLKRDFPRIPFYDNFWQWENWGKELMDLHLNYESQPVGFLDREDKELDKSKSKNRNQTSIFDSVAGNLYEKETAFQKAIKLKVILKADKEKGLIYIDEQTTLSGIDESVWKYLLGNRSALEWVLDQYKEKKPKDPTIRDKFDTYRFVDYKEEVIELLQKVYSVSLETIRIIEEMKKTITHDTTDFKGIIKSIKKVNKN
jgi:predicted helicase